MKSCRQRAESREGLTAGPPYYILEPSQTYPDGSPREDGESLTASSTFRHAWQGDRMLLGGFWPKRSLQHHEIVITSQCGQLSRKRLCKSLWQ